MTAPNLLRLTRVCAKWRVGVLLAACLALAPPGPLPVPGAVTDLRVSAATDSALVLTWTEVPSGVSNAARYVVRYGPYFSFTWTTSADVRTGGCGAPVYGSTGTGGRTRSCVLTGLRPDTMWAVQIAAYTGTLNSTAIFGPLSNVVHGRLAKRIGTMLVLRPPLLQDSVQLTQVEFSDWPNVRWPLQGVFWTGDHVITAYHGDSVVARGLLVVSGP